jgi:aldehyde:ferredoxin oxidoreductase
MVDWGNTNEEAGIGYFSRHDGGEKAANVARHQDWRTVYNSLVMCIFANVSPQTQVELINAACGLQWDVEEMMRCRRTRLESEARHQQSPGPDAPK